MKRLLPFFAAALYLTSFPSSAMVEKPIEEEQLLIETRLGVSEMPVKLMETLKQEIAKGDLVSAINICKEKAPQMAQAASAKTGWHIRRVSEKNRNPSAIPDAWEAQALKEFTERASKGEALSVLEKGEIVITDGQRHYRYIKALPTQPLCLACHGESSQISDEVKDAFKKLYPNDKATGYGLNQIRGGLTVIRPLDSVTPAKP